MFESAKNHPDLTKKDFKKKEPSLRQNLLSAQLEVIAGKKLSVVVVVEGLNGAGKVAAIARLHEWMDTRHLICNAYNEPMEEERLKPRLWRYWRDLPAAGQTSVVFGSWYQDPVRARVLGETSEAEFSEQLDRIARFETMLARENVLLVKFWLVLPRKEQEKRLKALTKSGDADRHILAAWADPENHAEIEAAGESLALKTSTAEAPWHVIPAEDPHYRDATMVEILSRSIRARLEAEGAPASAAAAISSPGQPSVEAIDLTPVLDKEAYEEKLETLQGKIALLTGKKAFRKRGLVCVFQGNDAAGKGGAIRRVTRTLDPRLYKVHPISAPTDEEKARPYLWRFWRRLPMRGRMAVFDRSWYERVLVERVEGFASDADWMRAYGEINAFEADLNEFGLIVCKFWLAISAEEQLRRFKAREETAHKRHKITDEDWRNRLKWDAYAVAAGDMVDRTSTSYAPWSLISSEDKRHARIAVLETLCNRLEAEL